MCPSAQLQTANGFKLIAIEKLGVVRKVEGHAEKNIRIQVNNRQARNHNYIVAYINAWRVRRYCPNRIQYGQFQSQYDSIPLGRGTQVSAM